MVDAERDASAATRREDAFRGQGHLMGQAHVHATVDGRDVEGLDLADLADDHLHPQVADDQRFELHGRAEQRQESIPVDVHGQRLLADHLAGDLLDPLAPDP